MRCHPGTIKPVILPCLFLTVGLITVLLSGCGSPSHSAFGTVGSAVGSGVGRAPATAARGDPLPAEATTAAAPAARQNVAAGRRPQAGTLTAGSFDDTANFPVYTSFLGKIGQKPDMGDLPGRFSGRCLVVTAVDGTGAPIGNARVRITAADGKRSVELVSRTDGRVVFLPSWDQVASDDGWVVTVVPADGARPVQHRAAADAERCTITVPGTKAALPQHLDLVLVLDTTGSMGDELEYLKSEIRGIASAVHERYPQVQKRYALIVYRDEGDEYVTRSFGFTPSIDTFRQQLAAQSATGGGDYPEAVHAAMESAVQLPWREGPTARVLFHVADAPPHAPQMARTMKAVDRLRKQGVAIYPVACSGYDDACEFVMRSSALLTGGQFLFLTDDSGVGDAHGEPHIPHYQVQRLNALMIRTVAGELAGRRVEAKADEVLRTVGKPPKGLGGPLANPPKTEPVDE